MKTDIFGFDKMCKMCGENLPVKNKEGGWTVDCDKCGVEKLREHFVEKEVHK